MIKHSIPITFVPKGWGFEKWIVNCDEYCGILLYFVIGKRCSWHYHKLKDERAQKITMIEAQLLANFKKAFWDKRRTF